MHFSRLLYRPPPTAYNLRSAWSKVTLNQLKSFMSHSLKRMSHMYGISLTDIFKISATDISAQWFYPSLRKHYVNMLLVKYRK